MTLALYIARQFAISIFTALGGLLVLSFLLDLVELIRRAAAKSNVNLGNILEMAFMKSPEMIMNVLPFAVLIGSMMALTRLTRRSELVAARASGVSVWQFLRPGWVVALLIGVGFVTLFNPISAAMLSRFEQLEARYISGRASVLSLSSSGLWLRDYDNEDSGRERIFHALNLDQHSMTLHKVIIFQYGNDSAFIQRMDASEAKLQNGYWDLKDVVISIPGKPGEVLPNYTLATKLTLEQIQDSFASPETLSFWELPQFIRLLEDAGFSALRHKLYFQTILSLPLLLVGMVFIGATFSLRSPRRGRVVMLVTGGMVAGFFIYFLTDLIHAMGLSGSLPLLAAAWIPPLATLLAGIWMILHLENG